MLDALQWQREEPGEDFVMGQPRGCRVIDATQWQGGVLYGPPLGYDVGLSYDGIAEVTAKYELLKSGVQCKGT